jgi:hypothetical protein
MDASTLIPPRWIVEAAIVLVAVTGCHSDTHASPAPTVPVSALSGLLLTTDELAPILNNGPLEDGKSSDRMRDDVGSSVKDHTCVGVYEPAQESAFAGSGSTAVRVHTAEQSGHQTGVIEAVIAFPSAEVAAKFFDEQTSRWKQCSNGAVTFNRVSGDGQDEVKLGSTAVTADGVLTNQTASDCQHAMAVRVNVVIDVSACNPPMTSPAVPIVHAIIDKFPKR